MPAIAPWLVHRLCGDLCPCICYDWISWVDQSQSRDWQELVGVVFSLIGIAEVLWACFLWPQISLDPSC